MHHGTVCIILDDGASSCPAWMLPKKQAVDHQIRTHLSHHDRIKFMVMQDSGINLNHLIAASKVIDFYNDAKQNEGIKRAVEVARFGAKTSYALSEHLAEMSRSFVDKMDHLNAMQFRLMGAQGKEFTVAHREFRTAYFDAMDELNKVSKLNFISPDTQAYFDSQTRVRNFGRAGVYINDLEDIARLKKIAEMMKSINAVVAKFGVLASGGEIIYDAATGGDWQKDVKDTIIEYTVERAVGVFFSLFTPEGWMVLLLECVLQVYASDKISDLAEHPATLVKLFKDNL